ncbi:MAG: oligosaccharide flippase family protein [Geodermatophilaceae bacterium]|nr:oligosaccharide flippase family protein [Geodermatophilaceae bacterium]
MTEALPEPSPALAGTRKSGKNAVWLVFERVVHLGVAFVVSIVVARALGKEDLGSLAIGLAFLLLVGSVINPAVQCLLRDVIAKPAEAGRLYAASAASVGIVTSLFYLLMAAVIGATMGFGSTTGVVILIVVGSALLRPLNVVDAWFKMELQSRPAVLIRIAALLLTGAARVALPLLGYGIVAVAWTYVIEAALVGIGLWIAYRRMSDRDHWVLESSRVGATLKEFAPLLITSSSALIYLRLDQAMVGWLSGLSEAGLFAVASSMAEAPRFALLALFISVAPRLLKLKNRDPERYQTELIAVTRVLVLLGYLLTLALVFIMAPLAPVLLGPGFEDTRLVIVLLALSTPFVCIGGLLQFMTNWERWYREAIVRNVIGAVLSIGVNFALLPKYGAVGAAISSFIAYLWVFFLGALVARRTRAFFWMALPALEPVGTIRMLLKRRRKRAQARQERKELLAAFDESP